MACKLISAPVARMRTTTSTNDELAQMWRRGSLVPFTAVTADFQTLGRGRLGRPWVAAPGTSLLMSVLVNAPEDRVSWVPLMAGLAVADTIAELLPAEQVELKWPNDVLVNDLKIAGILAERLGTDDRDSQQSGVWVAVGIGINLTQARGQLPPVPATSLQLQGATAIDGRSILDQVRNSLATYLEADEIGVAYEARCASVGRSLTVAVPAGETITGRGRGIGANGELLVEDATGVIHEIHAGDATFNPGGLH